jgi:hypothetical protein
MILTKNHKYRRKKQQFDGKEEKELPPKHHDGRLVFEMIKNIHVIFGKAVKEKITIGNRGIFIGSIVDELNSNYISQPT